MKIRERYLISPKDLAQEMTLLFVKHNRPEGIPDLVQYEFSMTVTFTQLKGWLVENLKIGPDGPDHSDFYNEIVEACRLCVKNHPHLFQFDLYDPATDPDHPRSEFGFKYTGGWTPVI